MFPPLLFAMVLVAGMVLHWFRPWSPFPNVVARPTGAALMVSALALANWGRRTMEAADVLYGVTMEEAGCSRLVSVNFAEVEA